MARGTARWMIIWDESMAATLAYRSAVEASNAASLRHSIVHYWNVSLAILSTPAAN